MNALNPSPRTPTEERAANASLLPNGITFALRRLYRGFSRRRRVQLFLLGGLTLLGALGELVTLGALVPLLALVADPTIATSLPVVGDLFVRAGWNEGNLLLPVALSFGVVTIAAAGLRLLLAWASQKYVYGLGHDIATEVYRRTLYQPYPYHVARNSSALIADVEKVEVVIRSVLMPLMYAMTSSVIAAFILAGLLAIDPQIAVVTLLAFTTLYLVASLTTRRRLHLNSRTIASARTERIKAVQEGLGGIRDVLIDSAQPIYLSKFSSIDASYRDALVQNAFIGAAPRYILEASGVILLAALAVILARGPGGLTEAIPVLGALAVGAQRLLPLLQLIYNGWANIAGNYHNLIDVLRVLEEPIPEIAEHPTQLRSLSFEGSIVLEKVSFKYGPESPLVLQDFNLVIPRGSRVAIVGRSGSGKSTLIDLIMGLLSPTTGTVRIDGVALTATNVAAWQAHLAHVPQSIFLSDASIAENIAFGVDAGEVDQRRLDEAVEKAALREVVSALPNGYRSRIGERGVQLSGGQRQRVGIARALYRQADVLVLDEATSALDPETAADILHQVSRLDRQMTILIIAHDQAALPRCDLVVTL